MASKFVKSKESSTCAVATCMYQNANKAKRYEKEISFYKFPKNLKLRKQWTLKCKRMDNWKPIESYICSNHFCENDFMRDLKSELFGSNPKKLLKPEAVPTQNLPIDHIKIQSTSAMRLHSTTESKTMKLAHDQILTTTEESLTYPSKSASILNPEPAQIITGTEESLTQPSTSTSILNPKLEQVLPTIKESQTQPSTSASILNPEPDQIITGTEESHTQPSTSTSILNPKLEQVLPTIEDSQTQPSTSASILNPEPDQIITGTEESLTKPSTSTSILNPESQSEIEQLMKLYKDLEAIQHENEILYEKWNYHKSINESIHNEMKLVKENLRETNLKIKESDRRMEILNQTWILIQKRAKEFRMGYHKEN